MLLYMHSVSVANFVGVCTWTQENGVHECVCVCLSTPSGASLHSLTENTQFVCVCICVSVCRDTDKDKHRHKHKHTTSTHHKSTVSCSSTDTWTQPSTPHSCTDM